MLKGAKVIVFGASVDGMAACSLLSADNEILYICDNDESKWGTFIGEYKVVSPGKILDNKDATIVIAVAKRYNEVAIQLHDIGICNLWHFAEYINLISGEKEYRLRLLPCNVQRHDHGSLIKIHEKENNTNLTHSKRVLICANLFPPVAGGGVQRPLKFAKYLKKFGYEPIVVTKGNCEPKLSRDYSLLNEVDGVSVIRIQEKDRHPEEMDSGEISILSDLFYSIGLDDKWLDKYFSILNDKWELLPDNDVVWVLDCIKEIEEAVDLRTISIVFTTIAPYSTALLGAYLKLRYGLKWVLDYRDPWCLNDYNMKRFYSYRMERRSFERELEIALLNHTDHVVATSEVYCDEFIKACDGVRTICITNGYDETDFQHINSELTHRDAFRILFNGTVYKDFDICFIIKIINELIADEEIDKNKIRLEFNGSTPFLDASVNKTDIYKIVEYNGYLRHEESIKKMYESSILLVFGSYGDGAYSGYTGKLFEYLRTGIPILSISSPYGVHYEMVEEHHHGITATIEDSEKIKNFVCEVFRRWQNNGTVKLYQPDEYVKSFSREHLCKRLADVFDEVLDTYRK